MLPSANKNSVQESNPMLQPLYLYLSGASFLDSFTDPNKQFFNVKQCLNFLTTDLVCKRYIYIYYFFGDINIIYIQCI